MRLPTKHIEFLEEFERFSSVAELLRFAKFKNQCRENGFRVVEPATVENENVACSGSFDPITRGHLDLFLSVLKFSPRKLTIAIATNPDKKPEVFAPLERKKFIEAEMRAVKIPPEKVEIIVVPSCRFLVDELDLRGISKVIRSGIRNKLELEPEIKLANHNLVENQRVETLFFQNNPEVEFISSSATKLIDKLGGISAHEYVSARVLHALQARNRGVYFLGVTGISGSGKSIISIELKNHFCKNEIPAHHINFDKLAHEILSTDSTPKFVKTRQILVETFGNEISNPDGSIDRSKLGEIVFGDAKKVVRLNEIMRNPILLNLKRNLHGKKGVVILDAALLVEFGLTHLTNQNILLVDADENSVNSAVANRDEIDRDLAKKRNSHALSTEKKRQKIQEKIDDEKYGNLIEIKNNRETAPQNLAEKVVPEILRVLDIFGELRIKSVLQKFKIVDTDAVYKMIKSHYLEFHRKHYNSDNLTFGLDILDKLRDKLELSDTEFRKLKLTVAQIFRDMVPL
ncbi:MAG: dephospho-CoA kinase [Patescibacteria group bacterium]